MMDCSKMRDYLSGELNADAAVAFEAHMGACDECRVAKQRASQLDVATAKYLDTFEVPEVTASKADSLVERAGQPESSIVQTGTNTKRVAFLAVASIAAMIVLGVLLQDIFDAKETPGRSPGEASLQTEPWIRVVQSDSATLVKTQPGESRAEVGDNGRLVAFVGKDRIELYGGSRANISSPDDSQVVFELETGKISVEASKRSPGESLTVVAGEYRVLVVGTIFSVAMGAEDNVTVAVTEGKVQVTGSDEEALVVSAAEERVFGPEPVETSKDDHLATPTGLPHVKPGGSAQGHGHGQVHENTQHNFDRNEVRTLIKQGQLDEAARVLNGRLSDSPKDFHAWVLLAECKDRAGKWNDAMDAYKRATAYADPRNANRTRYKEAVLAQDKLKNPGQAAKLLKAYVAQNPSVSPLAAQALLRLAKAQLSLGQKAQAVKNLDLILQKYAGSSAVIEARQLRNEI